MSNIKLLICCHKKSEVPTDDIYLPIHVGKKRNNIDLGIQTDCEVNGKECDNISDKNNIYCEMTAMYWAWKNITKLYPDIEYVGLCHYRRFYNANWSFLDKLKINLKKIKYTIASAAKHKIYGIEPLKNINSVFEMEFQTSTRKLGSFVKKYDFVSTYPFTIINNTTEMFFQVIGRKYIELMTEIIDEDYKEYSIFYHEQLNSNKLYAQNMVIMKTSILDEYCSFVFSVLEKHIKLTIEKGICSDPFTELTYDRLSGYLSEVLTSTFVRYAIKKYNVGFTGKYFVE